MAKSADAADLKSAGRKAVGVQVPLRAPVREKIRRSSVSLFLHVFRTANGSTKLLSIDIRWTGEPGNEEQIADQVAKGQKIRRQKIRRQDTYSA
jgi:hypothetical protein